MCIMIMYTVLPLFSVNKIMPRKEIQTWWTYFKAHIWQLYASYTFSLYSYFHPCPPILA